MGRVHHSQPGGLGLPAEVTPVDLGDRGARLATFDVDPSGTMTWSTNAGEVLACGGSDVGPRLADLLSLVRDGAEGNGSGPAEVEHRFASPGGTERIVLVTARPVEARQAGRSAAGRAAPAWHGAVVDITAERRAERELLDLIDRYRLLVELSPDAIVVHEAGQLRYANAAAGELANLAPRDMIGRSIVEFIHPDDLESTLLRILSLTEPGMVSEPATLRLMTDDAGPYVIESVSVRTTWEGRPAYQVIMRDVAEREEAKAALAWAASHDDLTELPNRWAMTDQIEAALDRDDRRLAVLFCDLDRFKDVNDSLGHRVGDLVLCEVADRLRALMRPGDVVGRLGGDEFLVLCHDVTSAEAVAIAEGIVADLSRPIDVTVQGTAMTVTLGASVGAVRTAGPEGDAHDVGELLQAADAALYKAKARGRNRVEVFDVALREEARRRLDLREELRLALERAELDVHYQPIVRTHEDAGRCELAGVEALVRWTHATRGAQAPSEFIPVAEDSGLISHLGLFVLEAACRQAAVWRRSRPDFYVSVNLSARQLSERDLVGSVHAVLERTGLPASGLWLELTESTLADEGVGARGVLDELVGLGVRLAIDDFGTGYSSLGRLRRFPVSALKVDRSFIADMTSETAADGTGDGGAIAESTISLAHRLGLAVIAEGVETAGQLAALAEARCDFSQGFLLGRPAPAPSLGL